MSKTKFTKVAVSERLPKEIHTNTVFLTKEGNVRIFYNEKYLKDYEPNYEEDEFEYFLEESPDREDEMREMLEELVELKRIKDLYGKTPEYLETQPKAWEKAKSLLQSLKQEK